MLQKVEAAATACSGDRKAPKRPWCEACVRVVRPPTGTAGRAAAGSGQGACDSSAFLLWRCEARRDSMTTARLLNATTVLRTPDENAVT